MNDQLEQIINRLQNFYQQLKRVELPFGLTLVPVAILLLIMFILSIYWSTFPSAFNVQQITLDKAREDKTQIAIGSHTTSTLIYSLETLLDKPGGYLSNDILPPSVLLDNMPNWEYGVLIQARDLARAMRNDFSRSQSQSVEDKDLIVAEPKLNFDNNSWIFPATEGVYQEGIDALNTYLIRLQDPATPDAQFYARADNLRDWLDQVSKRLGSLSQRLSASVGQTRLNTDLSGDSAAVQSTKTSSVVEVKTPWTKIDDVFYQARGASWALIHYLKAIEIDFAAVLKKKNALISLRQMIRELESTQETLWSPLILNGSGFGIVANHSLVMASYISRANAAVIDLKHLLEQG